MSNIKGKAAEDRQLMDDLQDKLDFAVYEQEEPDPKKVREILAKMESMDSEADLIKKEFDKSRMWEKLNELCDEEMAEESAVSLEDVRAAVSKTKTSPVSSEAFSEKGKRGKSGTSTGKSTRFFKIVLSAATLILALFVGANLGTYATERKGVIELVKEMNNGTSFRVTGDAVSMDVEQTVKTYYSWNDVPNEYKEFLIIPQGLPEDMGLYDIKVLSKEIVDELVIRYIDSDATKDLNIHITVYPNEEFSFANLIYDDDYELLEQKIIGEKTINYYYNNDSEFVAQFISGQCVYGFGGKMEKEVIQQMVEKTIVANFLTGE